VSIYPRNVQERIDSLRNVGSADDETAYAKDASLVCGSFVAFSIGIDADTKAIIDARFQTNGCGYMIAAADYLTETVKGKQLGDLHGLNENDLRDLVSASLGEFDAGRRQCVDCCIRALRSAFAEYRASQISEFRGESALICTCFGVAEETIEMHIEDKSLKTVDDVTRICNAGGGCGSCRMLIQEILDSHWVEKV
jgi:NifU-like protein